MQDVGKATRSTSQCLKNVVYALFSYRLRGTESLDTDHAPATADTLYQQLLDVARPDRNGEPVKLWEQLERGEALNRLHPDLFKVVDRILHGGPVTNGAAGSVAPFFGRAPLRVTSRWTGSEYLLDLGPAARDRLASMGVDDKIADHVGVRVQEAILHVFASGVAVLVLGMKVICLGSDQDAVPVTVLEEATYALGHAEDRGVKLIPVKVEQRSVVEDLPAGASVILDGQQYHGVRKADPTAGESEANPPRILLRAVPRTTGEARVATLFARSTDRPSLPELADSFVSTPDPLLIKTQGKHGRTFLYGSALLEKGATDAELVRLAYVMSRRYGTDYVIESADIDRSVIRPFGNIAHAMATQGGAVVARDIGTEFIGNYIAQSVAKTYLPLAIVNYHEYLQLLRITQECAFIPDDRHIARDVEHIQNLRRALATFRLFFRFSHVSDMANHNQVHLAWREALGLDLMLTEAVLDVREADLVLDRAHRESRGRRWRWWAAFAGFLGTAVVATHLVEAWWGLVYPWQRWILLLGAPTAAPAEHWLERAHLMEARLLLLAAAVGLVAGAVAYFKGPRVEE